MCRFQCWLFTSGIITTTREDLELKLENKSPFCLREAPRPTGRTPGFRTGPLSGGCVLVSVLKTQANLDKLLNFFAPSFLICKLGMIIRATSQRC